MKIAFIGIGKVGFAIANNLQKIGHQIIIANNNVNSNSVKNAIKKIHSLPIKVFRMP
jgi:8-hydroxy-5-deazaflavin:NADPH oxidoreductase